MTTRTVTEIAELCGAILQGDGHRTISGLASLSEATAEDVSFLSDARYSVELEQTRAGAVLIPHGLECGRQDLALLRCENPGRLFTRVIEVFRPSRRRLEPGVHPSAVLDEGVEVGAGAAIGALAYIGPGTVIGEGALVHPRVSIGPDCRIGARTQIHSGAVIYGDVQIGSDCIVHAGAVLGSDGFGFDYVDGTWEKIPQCGSVILEDHVEVGANCTIDRGRFGATRILLGSKLDNLVHVAHNVSVGPHACLVAQVGISGSTRVGRGVILAGQVGVAGHLEIGDGAQVGGQSAVMKSLAGSAQYLGTPARPKDEFLRSMARVARLPRLMQRVADLERRLVETERRGACAASDDKPNMEG